MNVKKIISGAAFFILVVGVIFAQNAGDTTKKEESIEELYLMNPALRIAYETSRSEERESKLLAISQINDLIDKGVNSKDEEQITVILRDLSAQGTTIILREKGRLINYYVDVRREACRALGTVKSAEAKRKAVKVLISVLYNDDDPIVKSNAAYALGNLGINENEESASALARALEIQDNLAPNDNFAYSSILAIKKIAETNNGMSEPAALRVLVRITQGNYNRSVKDKALEVLQLLRKYSK
jgi:HEAT repeat protein